METYKINQLFGEAYNNAINNIINTVNKLGWNWDYQNNCNDAHFFAEETNIKFDCNGNYVD